MTLKVKLKSDVFEKLLTRLNLSANEFGRQCGISSAYMSQIAQGKCKPSGKTRRKILYYLNKNAGLLGQPVEFDDLFEIEG